jgi:hypothetical protein
MFSLQEPLVSYEHQFSGWWKVNWCSFIHTNRTSALFFSLAWYCEAPRVLWMQINMIAFSVKYSCWYWFHVHTPSFQSFAISSMSGYRNTSISVPACFGPWIRIDNITYFLLWHNHVGMLYIARMTGRVLCMVLFSPNGFIASVLKANLIFLLSTENSGGWRSIFSTELHP